MAKFDIKTRKGFRMSADGRLAGAGGGDEDESGKVKKHSAFAVIVIWVVIKAWLFHFNECCSSSI